MKKLIYKFIRLIVLLVLLAVITVFALLMLKRFNPQMTSKLPFNNNLTEFEIQSKTQMDKIIIPVQENFLNLKEKIFPKKINQNTGVEKLFENLK